MLPDEQQHEIVYALEYAMLAILDRLPPPMPPPETWSDIYQRLRDTKDKIVRPIPVPRDWEPSLKLPRKMMETQSISELESQISRLQRLTSKALIGNNDNGYIGTAYNYLTKATVYVSRAKHKEFVTCHERILANCKRTADRLRAKSDKWRAEKESKARAEQPNPNK